MMILMECCPHVLVAGSVPMCFVAEELDKFRPLSPESSIRSTVDPAERLAGCCRVSGRLPKKKGDSGFSGCKTS